MKQDSWYSFYAESCKWMRLNLTLIDATLAGIVVDFCQKKKKKNTSKKHPRKKSTFLAKSTHFTKKLFWSRKKALSKHYFINKRQQESTYN